MRVAFLVGFLCIGGCVATQPAQKPELTPEQLAYTQEVNSTDTRLVLDADKGNLAWQRAQEFLSKYGSMKIQIATDNVLQTYNATRRNGRYSYNVTRIQEGDSVRISIDCRQGYPEKPVAVSSALFNAKALSLYMQTGKLMPETIRQNVPWQEF